MYIPKYITNSLVKSDAKKTTNFGNDARYTNVYIDICFNIEIDENKIEVNKAKCAQTKIICCRGF